MQSFQRLLQSCLTLVAGLVIGSGAFAQSPAEREAQRLVPRTPGNWPANFTEKNDDEKLKRPLTAIRHPSVDALQSGYCKYSQLYAKPEGYLQYYSVYETCVEPAVHDNPPLGYPSVNFEELCHNAAFVHNPQVPGGMVQSRWVFACTLEKFNDTLIQISVKETYNYNNPDGACYNDNNAICGNTINSTVRTTCSLTAQEPMPEWRCYLDGAAATATADRRTESLPIFNNPVPTDPASRESLRKLIEDHVKARL